MLALTDYLMSQGQILVRRTAIYVIENTKSHGFALKFGTALLVTMIVYAGMS